MFDTFNQDVLEEWEVLPYLESTYPKILDQEDVEASQVFADLLRHWRQPRTLGDMAEVYVGAGELSAARRIAQQLDRATRQHLEERCLELTRRYEDKTDIQRARLIGTLRLLDTLGLVSEPWFKQVERSRRLASNSRPGPALAVIEKALTELDTWKTGQQNALEEEIHSLQQPGEQAFLTPRRMELIEAAKIFLGRKDLVNTKDAVRAARGMGEGAERQEGTQLILRARTRAETDIIRVLPAAVEGIGSLREVQLLLKACAPDATAKDTVPPGFAQAWAALPVDAQSRNRQLLVSTAAQLVDGSGSSGLRERASKEFFRALEALGDVLIDKQQKLRWLRGDEVAVTELSFKNPWFGPSDIQERKPVPLYVVLATDSQASLQLIHNDLASRRSEDRLAIVVCLRRAAELQATARQTRRALTVLDSASLLRIVFSRNTSKAFFREVMQQLDLGAISPYRPLDVVSGYMFRGRTAEIQRFVNTTTSFIVYGGRMMGKSSLLHRTAQELGQRGWVAVERSCEPLRDPRTRIIDPLSLCEYLLRGLTGYPGQLKQPRDFVDQVAAWLDEDNKRKVAFFVDEVDDLLEPDQQQGFAVCGAFKELAHQRFPERVRFFFAGFKRLYDATMADARPLTRFAADYKIEPLDEQAAHDLIREPLELMGIQFEEGQEQMLLAQIHNFTSNHPSLVQKFCQLIVEKMVARRTGPPYWLSAVDIGEVFKSDVYREYVRFTLLKNYEPIQELIVLLAIDNQRRQEPGEDSSVRFSAKTTRKLLLEWLQDAKWADYLSVQRIDVWLQELKVLRVLDVDSQRDYRFALSVYPRILSDSSNVEERVIELVDGIQRIGPDTLERPERQRVRPTTLHHLRLMVRDKQRHHILIGLPGCGRTKSIEEIHDALEDETRDIRVCYAEKAGTFAQFIKDLADLLLAEGVARTETQIRREIEKRAAQNGRPLVLLIDGPSFAARPKEAERFFHFFATFPAAQRDSVWIFVTGGIELWRSYELFRTSNQLEGQSYRVTFLGRFRLNDTQLALTQRLPDVSKRLSREVVERIHTVSGGHPLVLNQLMEHLGKAGEGEDLGLIVDRFHRNLSQAKTAIPELWKRTVEVFDRRSAEVLRLVMEVSRSGAPGVDELAHHLVADPQYERRKHLEQSLRIELEPLVQVEQMQERAGRYHLPDEDPIGRMLQSLPFDADFLLHELNP